MRQVEIAKDCAQKKIPENNSMENFQVNAISD